VGNYISRIFPIKPPRLYHAKNIWLKPAAPNDFLSEIFLDIPQTEMIEIEGGIESGSIDDLSTPFQQVSTSAVEVIFSGGLPSPAAIDFNPGMSAVEWNLETENFCQPIPETASVEGKSFADRYWERSQTYADQSQKIISKIPAWERVRIKPWRLLNAAGSNDSEKASAALDWNTMFVILQPAIHPGMTDDLLFPSVLFPHQVEGVRFLRAHKQAVLADEMGMGKSVTAIAAMKAMLARREIRSALVVCPFIRLNEWGRHLDEWMPEAMVRLAAGKQDADLNHQQQQVHVLVCAYEFFLKMSASETREPSIRNRLDLIVFDEVDTVKPFFPLLAEARKKIKISRLWVILDGVDVLTLDEIGAVFDGIKPRWAGLDNLDKGGKIEIDQPYLLGRQKQDVLKELPPDLQQKLMLMEYQQKTGRLHP